MKTVYIKRNDLFKSIDMLLCNNITKVDEDFIEDNMEIFYSDCTECKGEGDKCEECSGEGRHESEPYQYFLTNLNDWKKEEMEEFGLEIGYSEALGLHVIPIYDFGTSWDAFSYSKEVSDDYELLNKETLTRNTHY